MKFSNYQKLLFGMLVVCTLGCTPSSTKKEETEWKTVAGGNFTMKIPTHMKEATELHGEAILQYQNPVKEFYCIAIQEGESVFRNAIEVNNLADQYPTTLEGYARLIGDSFTENVEEIYTKSELKPIRINGHEGQYFDAEAKAAGTDIYYHYGFVKGDTTYYQIITWTLLDRKSKYADDMLNTLESFKEN